MKLLDPASYDFLAPSEIANPYPSLRQLQEQTAVFWSERLRAWVVTRYADVRAAFRNPALNSDRVGPVYKRRLARDNNTVDRDVHDVLSKFLVFTDPPNHTRLRKLVEYAFRPRAIARMDTIVQGLVEELLDDIGGKSDIDFIHQFADPLPVRFIAGMFGVDRKHHADMAGWSDDIVGLLFGALDADDRHMRAAAGLTAFSDLIRDLIAERRIHRGDDVLSDLVAAQDHDDVLSDDEIIATCILLLFAGHETTRNLLANGVRNLLQTPGAWQQLGEKPDSAAAAVEEILRFDGPIKSMWRLAGADTVLGETHVASGQRVLLVQAAANRDPRRFDDPNTFNIARNPNFHVGFGYAAHYCMGAAVARLEGQLALKSLAKRFPQLSLATESFEYHPFIVTRAMKSLPVRLR
jgi:cytochrome P450